MSNKSLRDIYEEKKDLPTPAAVFVEELGKVTHRSEVTVRSWLSGKRPDINTQIVIAMYLKSDVETLFPPQENEESAVCNANSDGHGDVWT